MANPICLVGFVIDRLGDSRCFFFLFFFSGAAYVLKMFEFLTDECVSDHIEWTRSIHIDKFFREISTLHLLLISETSRYLKSVAICIGLVH